MSLSRFSSRWLSSRAARILTVELMVDHSARIRAALLGRYTIERELGRGGMATVYLARDRKHDRLVAVKVLRPELAAALGPERFLREIRLTAQLQHPHILTLIDSDEADGFLYYVMPYVDGESLRQRLAREGQLPVDAALRITRTIAGALDFAHARGIIHRDIKPENIMLHEGEAMVADFGIALAVSTAGRERLTETGLSLGTPAYMSPEQASAEPKLDGRTDQYSLACVLYEMLAGEPPYTGPSAQAIIAKRLTEPVPHLSTLRPVAPDVEAAVTKALAKAPPDRFGTTGAFAEALTAGAARTSRGVRPSAVAVLAVLVLLGLGTGLVVLRANHGSEAQASIVPFTSSTGVKFEPVFSPDGREIAYTWRGENDDNSDIYVKLVDAGAPLRLTSDPAEDYCPAWSPDGRYLAFIRTGPSGTAAYYVMPALGGAARKIADRMGRQLRFGRCMDWSPDGKSLIVADKLRPDDPRFSIVRISTEDGARTVVVAQPDQYVTSPTVSRDGRMIAYVQGTGFLTADIYVVPLEGGEPRRVSSDARLIRGLDWTPDGREIVFSSNRAGITRLWRISSHGGSSEPVSGAGDAAQSPTVASTGDRLAYLETRIDANIWRMAGPAWKGRGPASRRVVASSRNDQEGSLSLDGRKIVFASERTGNVEIWTSDSDGTNPVQLTSLKASDAGSPRWSPDAKTIAFDARVGGRGGIFTVSAEGGAPTRITQDSADSNLPTWSRDGKWIYFSSNRTGRWQIWKVPAGGGTATQVTRNGGFVAEESPDGRSLYVWVETVAGAGGVGGGSIWRVPLRGGEPVLMAPGVQRYYWWHVARDGMYVLDGASPVAHVEHWDFTGHRTKTIPIDLSGWVPGGQYFDVSSDGRWIIFDRGDQLASDIMLVENFR